MTSPSMLLTFVCPEKPIAHINNHDELPYDDRYTQTLSYSDDTPMDVILNTFFNFSIVLLMYMDYTITLIYLVDWVTWVSNLEGENVTESSSHDTYLYMFTKGLCLDRVDYLTTILSLYLSPPSIPLTYILVVCNWSSELSIRLYPPRIHYTWM